VCVNKTISLAFLIGPNEKEWTLAIEKKEIKKCIFGKDAISMD